MVLIEIELVTPGKSLTLWEGLGKLHGSCGPFGSPIHTVCLGADSISIHLNHRSSQKLAVGGFVERRIHGKNGGGTPMAVKATPIKNLGQVCPSKRCASSKLGDVTSLPSPGLLTGAFCFSKRLVFCRQLYGCLNVSQSIIFVNRRDKAVSDFGFADVESRVRNGANSQAKTDQKAPGLFGP